jgi:hypothetical protein
MDDDTREKDSGTKGTDEQEKEMQGQNLKSNQHCKPQTGEFNGSDSSSSSSSSSSSKSSHNEETKQTTPHQKSPAREDEQEEEEPTSIFRLATMAARGRAN